LTRAVVVVGIGWLAPELDAELAAGGGISPPEGHRRLAGLPSINAVDPRQPVDDAGAR